MSKLPSYRRLVEQDYPEKDQDLVKQLSASLNYGLEVIYSLLNGKLTFADNIDSTIKEIQVKVDADGKPLTAVSIAKLTNNKILGVMVVKVVNLTNSSIYPTSGVTISYTETTDAVKINNITGLTPNDLWSLTVITIR